MEALWNAEIEIILWLQSLGLWLAAPMRLASLFGNEEFFLLLLPVIYWSISASLGLRVGLMLLLSANINHLLKLSLHSPRPYWYSQRVMALSVEATFGIPSAHAQNTVAIWGLLAALVRRPWAWAAALLLSLVVGLSRIYLGVHFPSDVLAGWLIGAALLWMFMRWEPAVAAWLRRPQPGRHIILALLVSLVLAGLSTQLPLWLGGWQMPEAWVRNAIAGAGAEPQPFALDTAISTAGALFGLASGAAWLYSRGWFSTAGPIWKRLVRYLIGVVGVVIFWYGLAALLPRGDTVLAYSLRYLRYALVGLWVSGLAPALFIRLQLAEPAGELLKIEDRR
jgi:membrane-associated phospholipid phosphatase